VREPVRFPTLREFPLTREGAKDNNAPILLLLLTCPSQVHYIDESEEEEYEYDEEDEDEEDNELVSEVHNFT
jgi:hypothetical protein